MVAVILKMISGVVPYIIYGSIGVFFVSTAFFILGRDWFGSSVYRIRSTIRAYFFISLISLLTLSGVFYLATGLFLSFATIFLFIFAITVQIQVQIYAEGKIKGAHFKPIRSQLVVMRHWLIILAGAVLLLVLNALFSGLLLAVARVTHSSQLNKDLILWLRAPITILSCQFLFEIFRTYLLRFEFRAAPLSHGLLFDAVTSVARKYHLKLKKVFLIRLDEYGFNFVKGHKSNVFLSKDMKGLLTEKEFEFFIVQGLVDSQLKLESQRLLHYSIFAIGLFLPYILAGQSLAYLLPSVWSIPVWNFLYVTLLISQAFLKRSIDSLQSARKGLTAMKRVGISTTEMANAYEKLNKANRVQDGPVVIFGLPQAPRLAGVSDTYLARASMDVSAKRLSSLTFSARGLFAFTVFVLVASISVLKPKYDLRVAANRGDQVKLIKLLKSGINPNTIDISSNVTPTALLAAAQGGQTQAVNILLDYGADPNKKVPLPFSALVLAIQNGSIEMIKALVERGADVNYRGYKGYTPIMWACRLGRLDVTLLLVSHGAQVNARSDQKTTPLIFAVEGGNTKVVEVLLKNGADPRLRGLDKESPLDLAKRKGLSAIIALLVSKDSKMPSNRDPATITSRVNH